MQSTPTQQLLKTCSLSLFYSPPIILTTEVAAPENVYVEVAAPDNVYVEVAAPKQVYIRLRQEVNVNMIWCTCFSTMLARCMHVACGLVWSQCVSCHGGRGIPFGVRCRQA